MRVLYSSLALAFIREDSGVFCVLPPEGDACGALEKTAAVFIILAAGSKQKVAIKLSMREEKKS